MTFWNHTLANEFMKAALDEASRSNCVSRNVGAVIVADSKIIAAGWNGVPEFSGTCVQAGCPRCKTNDRLTGIGYDRCICVHAEQHAIAIAARNGRSCNGATLFSSLRPCITCSTNALAAGIERIVYGATWRYEDDELEEALRLLSARFSGFFEIKERG
jgi:dCMP deaminase